MKTTIIKLKDANVVDIEYETSVTTEYGGYCETCEYEEDVLTGELVFVLDDNTRHVFLDIYQSDYGGTAVEQLIGLSTGDLFKIFLNVDFMKELESTKLDDFNRVLAKRIFEVIDLNNSLFWSIKKYLTEDEVEEYNNKYFRH